MIAKTFNTPAIVVASVRVFTAIDATGNDALCLLWDKAPGAMDVVALTAAYRDTLCLGWWRRNALEVHCLQSGRAIQFCGHGLLAAAYLWQGAHRDECSGVLPLRNNGHLYFYEKRGDGWWLRARRIPCRLSAAAASTRTPWLPPPCESAIAGGKAGYRIWEWPMGTDIANLALEDVSAAVSERDFLQRDLRATILTARSSRDFSYVLRYLAPRYGNDEDAATGSANVVLADYWAQRKLPPPFSARQCSPEGGRIFADLDDRHVWITGAIDSAEGVDIGAVRDIVEGRDVVEGRWNHANQSIGSRGF